MKILCKLPAVEIWLADHKQKIFGVGNGWREKIRFVDSRGNEVPYDASYHPYPGSAEIEKQLQEEDDREHAEYVASVCDGLESFSDQEVIEEIDDCFGNFGFKDLQGNVVIEPQYAWVGEFSHGLCPVNLNRTWYRTPEGRRYYENHYGYIDTNGKTIIPFRFEEASNFNKYGVAVVADDTGAYMIDTDGNEIPDTRYPYLEGRIDYNERYIEFSPVGSQYGDDAEDNVGLYDTKERKILCEPKYEEFFQYDEDTIRVHVSVKDCPGDMRTWFINSKGEYKYPWQVGKGLALVERPDEYGNSVVAISSYKKSIETLENDIYCFYKGNETYERRFWFGLMGNNGMMLIPTEYENVKHLGQGLYACERDGKTTVFEL